MAKVKLVPIELVLLLLAFWHSIQWLVVRTLDVSDEPWGVVSLATVIALVITSWNRHATLLSQKLTVLAIGLIVAYCITFSISPPLIRCMIALLTLGVVVWNRIVPEKRNFIAVFGLLILSSPLLASLQFFVGFPLRLLVTNAAASVIRTAGTTLLVAGTAFEHQGRMILVDSPCSGINMLWIGFYLCFVLCWIKRLSFPRSLLLLVTTTLGVVATNVGRTITLVYIDILRAGGQQIAESAHDAVGLASFSSLAILLVLVANWLAKTNVLNYSVNSTGTEIRDKTLAKLEQSTGIKKFPGTESGTIGKLANSRKSVNEPRRARRAVVALSVASAVACLIPIVQVPYHEEASKIVSMEWPTEFEGRELKPVSLSSTETKFSSGFPGQIAKFTDGSRTILFRQVTKATRQLHPSSDCYKGNSFQLHPMAALRDKNGKVWSRFAALKDGRELEVREIVSDAKGHTWSDTSAWYWSALLGKTQSPWLAVTVATVAK